MTYASRSLDTVGNWICCLKLYDSLSPIPERTALNNFCASPKNNKDRLPRDNLFNRKTRWPAYLSDSKIKHSLHRVSDFDFEKDAFRNNFYFIELDFVYPNHFGDIGGNLISPAIVEANRAGILNIVFDYASEAYNLFQQDWFSRIIKECKRHNLNPNCCYLISGDLNIRNQYSIWKKIEPEISQNFNMTVIADDHFHNAYRKQVKARMYLRSGEGINAVPPSGRKTKDFLCFNAAARGHRLLLVADLSRLGLLEKNNVSLLYRHDPNNYETLKQIIPERVENVLNGLFSSWDSSRKEYIRNFYRAPKPINLDLTRDMVRKDDRITPTNLYEETFFSLVTETEFSPSNALFPTEKLFKPIAYFHPIILMAQPGTLKYLKRVGYETFPEMFDESYDTIENPVERYQAVLDQVINWTNLPKEEKKQRYNSVIPKLRRNRKLFLSGDNMDVYPNPAKVLLTTVKSNL